MAIRTYDILLDEYNSTIPEPIIGRQGDKDGAVLLHVTITDHGTAVDLTGQTINLMAETAQGTAVVADNGGVTLTDAKNGKFDYAIPKALWSESGKITKAYFSLSNSDGQQTTYDLIFIVKKAIGISQDEADDYIAIIDGTLRDLNAKVDDIYTKYKNTGYPRAIESEAVLKKTYPNGNDGVFVTIDTGHMWMYDYKKGNWIDGGAYQAVSIGNGTVTSDKLGDDVIKKFEDAKIGYDKHAYLSIGDAIRKQTKNNQDNNYYLQDNIINGGMLKTAPIIFVQGSLSQDADGNLSENNSDVAISKRIRSSVPFKLPRRTTFYLDTKYSFFFSKYEYVDGKYHFIQTFGDTNNITIDDNGANFYTIVIKQNDDSPIASTDAYHVLQIKSSSLLQEHDEKIEELNNDDILLNGFQGNTISSETHPVELTDFELLENVKNLTIDSNGNVEFEVANSNTWGAIVTTKAQLSLSCAIKGPGWVVVGMDDKSYTMIPLINATKGKLYSLTKGTVESTNHQEFDVADIWNKAVEGQSVFYFEKDGLNLKIYIQDSANKTLIINYDNCTAFGFVNSSTLQTNLINAKFTEYSNVTAAGIKQRVRALELRNSAGGGSNTQLQRFTNYSVLCIGDSITEKNSRASLNWVDYLNAWCEFKSIKNNGEGGTGILRPSKPDGNYKNWYSRLNDYTGTYDLILLMGNMNDYSDPAYLGADKLGKFGDNDLTTQYGAVNTYLKALMAKYPLARIGWITSTPRQYVDDGSHSIIRNDGYLYGLNSVFQDADQAIIDTCQNYSIPVLDLFHESGLAPWIDTNRKTYFSSTDTPDGDGVHPNALGQKIIANKIYDFVVRNF